MKKHLKQILIVLCLFAAPLGMYAQTLVFHLADGAKTSVNLPATFSVTPSGDKLVIAVGSDNIELPKDEIMCVTYRDAKGDVNGDMRVDVADVSTLVGLLIGKDVVEKTYDTCPDENHPHMIDLNLPSGTKWACCNVGALKPEDYGDSYAWGETEVKDIYNWSNYIHCDGSSSTCHDIGKDIAGTDYDVAHVKWGGSWVMPSLEQINELLDNTTTGWTILEGVNGRWFTGTNGGTIFLPAAGDRWGGEPDNVGSLGVYWSSTLNERNLTSAYELLFFEHDVSFDLSSLCAGPFVRPVRKN